MAGHVTSSADPRRVSVLGATGSVGRIAVDLLEYHSDRFRVEALVANSNAALLGAQAIRVNARLAVVSDPSAYVELKDALWGSGVEAAAGSTLVNEAAGLPSDVVVAAIVGTAGLVPTLSAIRSGASIALANKECLVSAGTIFMAEAARHGASVIPVDSEHSAIFQALSGAGRCSPERIILTSSGGPFRTWSLDRMRNARIDDALAHPNFSMGRKISVDSATMMNKGLELIEAYHLFDMPGDRIDILVHVEQVVHGLVEFADGAVLAQLGTPDMTVPVAVALAWPERMETSQSRLDLVKLGQLTFDEPDEIRFPALRLAREVLMLDAAASCVMNAANEEAVSAFLSGKIGFLDIVPLVSDALERCSHENVSTLDQILYLDESARHFTKSLITDACN